MRKVLGLSLLVLVQACSSGSDGVEKDEEPIVVLEDLCVEARGFAPGMIAFRDVSEAWGLKEIQANGTRISVADIDGDGLPDVYVRSAGSDDFSQEGTRRT